MKSFGLLRPRRGLPWQIMGDKVLILNPGDEIAVELNEVASFVWRGLFEHQTPQEICQEVLNEFDVEKETLESDVEGFLLELKERNLVEEISS